MNAPLKNTQYDLLTLHKNFSGVNNLSEFYDEMLRLDLDKLTAAYETLRKIAPRRHGRGKKYFVGHDGYPSGEKESNRDEEHLAMALYNDFATAAAPVHPALAAVPCLQLLDYQVPLKAQRGNADVGKVDLFAAIDDKFVCVIELKVDGDDRRGDTPLYAWIEALGYCAMVAANINDIGAEAKNKFGLCFAATPPRLMVMAPESYWQRYRQHEVAGRWQPALQKLADDFAARTGVQSYFVSLRNAKFSMGRAGVKPRLCEQCFLESALAV